MLHITTGGLAQLSRLFALLSVYKIEEMFLADV